MTTHTQKYMRQAAVVALSVDTEAIERMARELVELRERRGRLFLLGVGGSAANCSHAVNDFRKLAGIEAYTPCDNVAELTARTNDEGWETTFAAWLQTSNACAKDAVLVLSVGGGDLEKNVSTNIVKALDEARSRGLKIFGIVGRDGGYTRQVGDSVLIIPGLDKEYVTPHAESFQAVIWHCLVTHPDVMIGPNRWEKLSNTSSTRDAA